MTEGDGIAQEDAQGAVDGGASVDATDSGVIPNSNEGKASLDSIGGATAVDGQTTEVQTQVQPENVVA